MANMTVIFDSAALALIVKNIVPKFITVTICCKNDRKNIWDRNTVYCEGNERIVKLSELESLNNPSVLVPGTYSANIIATHSDGKKDEAIMEFELTQEQITKLLRSRGEGGRFLDLNEPPLPGPIPWVKIGIAAAIVVVLTLGILAWNGKWFSGSKKEKAAPAITLSTNGMAEQFEMLQRSNSTVIEELKIVLTAQSNALVKAKAALGIPLPASLPPPLPPAPTNSPSPVPNPPTPPTPAGDTNQPAITTTNVAIGTNTMADSVTNAVASNANHQTVGNVSGHGNVVAVNGPLSIGGQDALGLMTNIVRALAHAPVWPADYNPTATFTPSEAQLKDSASFSWNPITLNQGDDIRILKPKGWRVDIHVNLQPGLYEVAGDGQRQESKARLEDVVVDTGREVSEIRIRLMPGVSSAKVTITFVKK
ncbi:MAG: hypothetical protein NTZ38_03425 [Candidatus Taylorbacteria bacterium]|nr:hypothetical protein [Candidatus Taylorbacteria bacterium]